jgi:signal transduction histidine kinase
MVVILIISLAALVQMVAAFIAIRLIRVTGVQAAWILICGALCLMALRRLILLWRLAASTVIPFPNPIDEAVALAISAVIAAGVYWITPLILSIKQSEEALSARVAERTAALAEANLKMQSEVEERRRAETALETEHQKVFSLLDGLPALVYLKDANYCIRFANRTFRQIFGDPQGKRCFEAIYGAELKCEDCGQLAVLDGQANQVVEWTSPDGAKTFVLHNYPYADIDGTPLVLTLGLDITRRKRAEDELRRSAARLVEAERLAHLGSWELDPDSRQLIWSEEMYRIFNVDPEKFKPTLDNVLAMVHPDDLEQVKNRVKESISSGQAYRLEHRIIWPDDAVRVVQAKAEISPDAAGHPHMIGTLRDVTERRRGEAVLKQSESNLRFLTSKLLTAQETERRRISMELHDSLGQSLLVLKIQMKNMQRSLESAGLEAGNGHFPEMVASLDKIIDSVRRLSRDLTPAPLEDLGLAAALRSLIDTFTKHHKDIKVAADLDADIDHLFSLDQRINIFRIFQESLTNIGKYAHADQIRMNIKRKGDEVCFLIEDNGLGFDLTEVRSRKGGSRGLGLAAMEERVRMLRGALNLTSEPGQGSRISFTVPLFDSLALETAPSEKPGALS